MILPLKFHFDLIALPRLINIDLPEKIVSIFKYMQIAQYIFVVPLCIFWLLFFFRHKDVRTSYRLILRIIRYGNNVIFIAWAVVFILDFAYLSWRAITKVYDLIPSLSLPLIMFVYLSVYVLDFKWVRALIKKYQLYKPDKAREYEEKVLKRNVETPNPDLARIKKTLEKKSIYIGSVPNGSKNYKLSFNPEDFRRHLFIVGKTGMGKTTLIKNMVRQFCKLYEEIPVLIIEFKGEYLDLQDEFQDFLIIKPGENFSINIFNPYESDPTIHAQRIFQIINSCNILNTQSEFSPQMEKMLIEVLEMTCETEEDRSWDGFFRNLELYTRQNRNLIPMLEQTLVSVENRLHSFVKEPLNRIFNETVSYPLDSLFGCNTIIDLSSIIKIGGTKREILFFLNLVFKRLYDVNVSRGAFNEFRHITILEESQYFIPQRKDMQTKLSEYIEDIAMVQRGFGEVLITAATTPQVSENVINNSGIVFAFQSSFDDLFCENILGINRNDRAMLNNLSIGKCLVKISEVPVPFICHVSDPRLIVKIKKKKKKAMNKPSIIQFESQGIFSVE